MDVTAVKHTTMMSDNITAYSTAVGPSSLFRKRFNAFRIELILLPFQVRWESSQACWACLDSKLARCSELVCNVVKRRTCILADAGDSSQANNDNEGQHNSVFNRCWSVFTLQKTLDLHGEILHFLPSDRYLGITEREQQKN